MKIYSKSYVYKTKANYLIISHKLHIKEHKLLKTHIIILIIFQARNAMR